MSHNPYDDDNDADDFGDEFGLTSVAYSSVRRPSAALIALAAPKLSSAITPAVYKAVTAPVASAVETRSPAISAIVASIPPKPLLPPLVIAMPATSPNLSTAIEKSASSFRPAVQQPAFISKPTNAGLAIPQSVLAENGSKAAALIAAAKQTPPDAALIAAAKQTPPDAPPQSNPQVPSGGGSYQDPMPQGQPDVEWTPPPDVPSTSAAPQEKSAMVLTAMPTTPAAEVKESFWTRLLALFGFGKKKAAASMNGESGIESTCASLVRRARNGDQNAMALIALVRDNAKKGDARAAQSFAYLSDYVRRNPVDSNPRIGVDYVKMTQAPGTAWAGDRTYPDAVALSHGPLLANPRIGNMLAKFGGEEQAAIKFGMRHGAKASSRHPRLSHAVRMGKILSEARRIQAVRQPRSSLHAFDPNVGWELE